MMGGITSRSIDTESPQYTEQVLQWRTIAEFIFYESQHASLGVSKSGVWIELRHIHR